MFLIWILMWKFSMMSVIIFGVTVVSASHVDIRAESACTQCWVPSTQPEVDCILHYLCTRNNFTYRESMESKYDLFEDTACQALKEKNITRMMFLGDSYVRHIFQGFVVNLSGNYFNGSTHSTNPTCLYEGQIGDRKKCVAVLAATVCNDTVSLQMNQMFNVLEFGKIVRRETSIPGTIVFFGIGNHPIARFVKRLGVHNASVTTPVLYKNYCNSVVAKVNSFVNMKNVYWISTHRRLFHYFEDETEARILEFNLEMRDYVEKHCPPMGYIDVYNMTDALVTNHYNESLTMTFDRVHWGFTVNLLKTSIILNRILKQ